MNEPDHDNTYAYRSYNRLQNYLRMTIRMNMDILYRLFLTQIATVSILFLAALTSFAAPWELSFATFDRIWPFTLLIYLLHPVLIVMFRRRSRREFRERTRRGTTLAGETELARQLPAPGRFPLSRRLMLPESYETQHVFCAGASGTGKTVFLSRAIATARPIGVKAIIHGGKDGELAARFFNPRTDLIFNPFDERSLAWNIFDCIRDDSDFDAVAASIVPKHATREQFFTNAARDLLSGILRYCAEAGERSNAAVWQCLQRPASELYKLLVSIGSEAAAYIESATPQTQSCISTLMQHARIFRYLTGGDSRPQFSLHDWVADEEKQGFIFLTTRTKQRESLKGLMALFINSLSNEILSLRDDPGRRIMLFIDEFGGLQPMPAVKELLTLGRSKGCSFWIGIQEKAQLDESYGENISSTIINQCSTYAIFRMNDNRSAEYFSLLFGERESQSMESSYSSAARDRRETETYRNATRTSRLVLPAEIQHLPDLHYYLKIHNHPVTRAQSVYRDYPQVAPAFVANPAFRLAKKPPAGGNKAVPDKAEKKAEQTPPEKGGRFMIDDFDF